MDLNDLLEKLDLDPGIFREGDLPVATPITGATIARVRTASAEDLDVAINAAARSFAMWKHEPAPRRGELIRLFGEQVRCHKETLAHVITLETGKVLAESLGEVREVIDICEFAVGLSRQLYGLTMPSERRGHRIMEVWHPLGPVGVITAFNFPMAVWAWNFALAIVCGDPVVWKPSEKTVITSLACLALFERACADFHELATTGLLRVVVGGAAVARDLAADPRIKLVSATGSTVMGREVAPLVTARFGRLLLELGGNNGMIVAPSADLGMAERAVLFSAIGTTGQRCTSLRRLFLHHDIHDAFVAQLKRCFASLKIGNPLTKGIHLGPLINEGAFTAMQQALAQARAEGGIVTGGERVFRDLYPDAFYVTPALVEMSEQTPQVHRETFAPILYVLTYRDLSEAIRLHNAVPQGLSSSIFTNDFREAEIFMSACGSDCGLINVNLGPAGAEIGGAFGGEKETGGGREAGSDAWKAYMRRTTNTINYSDDLPLAQGIVFVAPR